MICKITMPNDNIYVHCSSGESSVANSIGKGFLIVSSFPRGRQKKGNSQK